MGSSFRSRWPGSYDNATEADTANTMSPSYLSSLFGSPSTPEPNQERNTNYWFPGPHDQFENEPTISPSTTPRQRRKSPRKINTPVVRTTPCGSIQKPISSDHLTKPFSILSLNRPRTPIPHSSPTRRPNYTLRDMWAMEQAGIINENDPSNDTLTALDSLIGSTPPSPDAEYTSDSENILNNAEYTPPPSPEDTSLMSLDQHLCCWMTGDNALRPIMCGWESLSHEDLWQHIMCQHFIEMFLGRLLCGWVCESEAGRNGRAVCGIGIRSLEEMREHVIVHVRNEGGRVG